MAQKFESIRYQDFSGGQNTKVVNHLILDSEVKLARNVILDDPIGAITKRKGYSQIGAQISSGEDVLGNYYFNSSTSAYSQHLVACDTAIYYNNSGTWTSTSTGWTADTRIRFESFLDRVFAFNGTDTPVSWAGTGGWGDTDLSSAPSCKYGRVFQDRFYFANESSNQSRVYFSSVPTSGEITWDTTNDYLDVNPEDGQSIKALEENSGRLLIFKDDSMFRWNGYSTEADPIIDVGTSSQESVKTIHGITYFFNRYGVYSYDGGMPYPISRKIQDWIDAIDQTTLADVTAEVDNDHYWLAVGDVTVDDVDYTNVVLVYHIPLKAWTIWTLADKPTFMAHYYSSGARLVSFGDSNGEVFRLNYGNDDDGTAIEVGIETKSYDLQTPEIEKGWKEVFVITDKGKGIVEIAVKLDNYPPNTIGGTKDDVTKLPSNLEGKKISVLLSESGTGDQWSFQQLIFSDIILLGTLM